MLYNFFTAVLLTVTMVFILKPVAQTVGLLDLPSARKQHRGAVPLIGGIAIYVSLLVSSLFFSAWKTHNGTQLILLSLPILLIGIADDHKNISVRTRLFVEIFCCIVAADYFNVRLLTLGELSPGFDAGLGWFSLPVTVFGMVGVMNAYNMVDGVDGLSGGLGILTFSSLALVVSFSDADLAMQLFTIAAAMVGFLVFNFRFPWRSRALIFMGDAGTMLIGFILGWYLILLSQGSNAVISPASALWFFAVPLMDTVAVMFRRILRGSSPFKPDCEHLHHIFMLGGSSVNRTVLKIYGLQLLCIGYALTSLSLDIPQWFSFWLFMACFLAYYLLMSRACKNSYLIRNAPIHDLSEKQ